MSRRLAPTKESKQGEHKCKGHCRCWQEHMGALVGTVIPPSAGDRLSLGAAPHHDPQSTCRAGQEGQGKTNKMQVSTKGGKSRNTNGKDMDKQPVAKAYMEARFIRASVCPRTAALEYLQARMWGYVMVCVCLSECVCTATK